MLHIGKNIFSLVISRVISAIILFLIYRDLVMYLGPTQAGQYGLLSSYLTVFSFFVDLGMSQLVIKKISEDRQHTEKYLTNYFYIQTALAFGFMLIMDAVVFFSDYPAQVRTALYITGLALFATSVSLPFRSVVIAFQKLTLNARINFINALINAVIMYLTITLHQGIVMLSFTALAIGIFNIFIYGWIVHRKFVPFRLVWDRAFVRQLFVWNTPFMLLTLFSVYNRVDGLLLPHLRNFTENGYYSAAYKLWDTLAFVPGVIGISLYPFFAEALNRGAMDEVKKSLEIYTRYMIAVGIPMAVGAFMLAKPLTLAIFGTDFLPAAPAVWLLVSAAAALFIYTPVNSLIVSKLTGVATKITGFNLLFNVVANLILTTKYGFVAAAAITLASELIQTIGYSYFVKRQVVNYKFFRNLVKPAAASAIMALALYLLRGRSVWLLVAAGGLVYFAALLVMRFFHAEDLRLFKAAISFRTKTEPVPETPAN